MTKRYFYSCPIEAMYMAKYFGVKLECDFTPAEKEEYDWESDDSYPFQDSDLGCPETIEDLFQALNAFRKIYVHPDSMEIFEPQQGDIAFDTDGIPRDVEEGDDREDYFLSPKEAHCVTQRKGRVFICPEEETTAGEANVS